MYQDAVKVPIGDWAKKRLSKLSDKDKTRAISEVGSGFGKNISNWVGKNTVYPNNVLHMATECANRNHSAVFPTGLPEWFIKLFTKEGDLVLDPFAGSGTTAVVAAQLGRNYTVVDVMETYKNEAEKRIKNEVRKYEKSLKVYSKEYSEVSPEQTEKSGEHQSTLVAKKEESILV